MILARKVIMKREVHTLVGTIAGGCAVAYRAQTQEPIYSSIETIAGCFWGYVGSRLPDIIEPALSPNHRQFAHSAIAGIGISKSIYLFLKDWEEYYRASANHFKSKQIQTDWLKKFIYIVLEFLFRIIAAGFCGLSAGYLSHLILDGSTPKGLPLVQ